MDNQPIRQRRTPEGMQDIAPEVKQSELPPVEAVVQRKWTGQRIASLLVMVLVAGAVIFGIVRYNTLYPSINGTRYSVDVTELDLRGQTLEEPGKLTKFTGLKKLQLENTGISGADCAMLRKAMPDCEISWTPLFQGKAYPEDTTVLTVTALSEEDIAQLIWFPQLAHINAEDCESYAAITALIEQRPDLYVDYSVTIGQREFRWDTTYARVTDADMAELQEKLQYLPKLKLLSLNGQVPPLEQLRSLTDTYPELTLDWELSLFGQTLSSITDVLDLTGTRLADADAVAEAMELLPKLERVVLCETGLPEAEIQKLRQQFESITFVWDYTIGGNTVRTDTEELDISGMQITPEEVEAMLPDFCNLKKVIMCDCGISNEDMDALNRRHEDILFVWTVELGPIVKVRTDITTFIPFKYCVDFYQDDLYNLRYCTEMVALDLGHQQIYNCEFVAFMPKLKYLVLADTKVLDLTPLTGLTELVYLEIFVTYLQDYTPLLTLTGLRDLNLSWTYGDYEIIAQMPWLERCWWGGMWHPYDQRAYLREKCPNTKFEFDDPESTGSGWRTSEHYYAMRDLLGMFYMA